jgi:hypothetical protein
MFGGRGEEGTESGIVPLYDNCVVGDRYIFFLEARYVHTINRLQNSVHVLHPP